MLVSIFRIRAYGSAAYDMCQVAKGTYGAYVEHGTHVWDIAAGKVIVEEAGGVVVDPSGRLTLKTPIATKVVCFFRLPQCLRSLYSKQCGPRSDCSYRSSLFWVHTVLLLYLICQ